MEKGQIFQPKQQDDGCRVEIIDVISDHSLMKIHSDEGCIVEMMPNGVIKNLMNEGGGKIECVCGEWL